MILPKKHIKLSESIIGISSVALFFIEKEISIDDLYIKLSKDKRLSKNISLDTVVLCLDYLYCQDIVELTESGGVVRCY